MLRNRFLLKSLCIFLVVTIVFDVLWPTISLARIKNISGISEAGIPVDTNNYVDLRTGDFHYEVPLLTVPGPEMDFPVKLGYSGGTSFAQEASWTGLGWNMPECAITRSVVGYPDDVTGPINITEKFEGSSYAYYYINTQLSEKKLNIPQGGLPEEPKRIDYETMVMRGSPWIWGMWYLYMRNYWYGWNRISFDTAGNKTAYGCLNGYEARTGSSDNKLFDVLELDNKLYDARNKTYGETFEGSLPAYDQYAVSGPGITGVMQPVILDNNSLCLQDGNTYKIQKNSAKIKHPFKFINEFSNSYKVSSYSSFAIDPITQKPVLDFGGNGIGYNYEGPDHMGFNKNLTGLAGASNIRYYTNQEIINGTAKSEGFIDYHISRTDYSGISGQIGGFSITGKDGTTYHYALPVYVTNSHSEYTATFKTNGTVKRIIDLPQVYAEQWKLTSITSSNFVDENNNGYADEEDSGGWINFEYGKWSKKFVSRTPLAGQTRDLDGSLTFAHTSREAYYLDAIYTRSHTALFLKEERLDRWSMGKRSNGGIDSTSESSLKLASVQLLRNEDLLSYGYQMMPEKTVWGVIQGIKTYSNTSDKYNSIIDYLDLYSQSAYLIDPAFIQKKVNLVYDYSLCKNHPTNVMPGKGRLTLLQINYKSRNDSRPLPSVDFSYDLVSPKSQSMYISVAPHVDDAYGGYFNKDRLGRIYFATTPAFEEGDIIKFTVNGIEYYATLLKGIDYNSVHNALFDVLFLGDKIPGSNDTWISTTAYETKNPPYTPEFYDFWGNFKSDYRGDGLSDRQRRTTKISARSTDVWSLRKINSGLGATMEMEYESDSYSNIAVGGGEVVNLQYIQKVSTNNYKFKLIENYTTEAELFSVGQEIELASVCYGPVPSDPAQAYTQMGYFGKNVFQINEVGDGFIRGEFKITNGTSVYDNPIIAMGKLPTTDRSDAPTYAIIKRMPFYGGGIRTKKITIKEGNGDYYHSEYTYSQNNQSSGVASMEPLGYDAVIPVRYVPSAYHATFAYTDFTKYAMEGSTEAQNYQGVFPLGVLYKNVQKKDYGNGIVYPVSKAYEFKAFEKNMYKDIILAANTQDQIKVVKSERNTGMAGQMLSEKTLDQNANVISETNYEYFDKDQPSNQGVIEQVFHEDLLTDAGGSAIVTIRSDYATALKKITATDYLKGTTDVVTNLAFDFYSGDVISQKITGSNKIEYISMNQPAYHLYDNSYATSTTPPVSAELGPKTNAKYSRNLLSPVASQYTFKNSFSTGTFTGVIATSDLTADLNFPTEFLVTFSNNFILPNNYQAGSVLYMTGFPGLPLRIVSIAKDRKSCYIASSAAVGNYKGSKSFTYNIYPVISSAITPWSKAGNYRSYNTTSNTYENKAFVDITTQVNTMKMLYQPGSSYVWNSTGINNDGTLKSTGTGAFENFDYSREHNGQAQNNASWKKMSQITLSDRFRNTLEVKDINGNYSAAKYSGDHTFPTADDYPNATFNKYLLASGNNTNYASFAYSSFEDLNKISSGVSHFGGEVTGGSARYPGNPTIKPHTGKYVATVNGGQTGPEFKARLDNPASEGGLLRGKTYSAMVWVHKNSPAKAKLVASVIGSNGTYSVSNEITRDASSNVQAGAWVLMKLSFDIPSNYITTSATDGVTISLKNYGTGVAYFDDLMVRPIDAQIEGYVYDPVTKLKTHTVNNEGLYVRNEYDDNDKIIAVYKETFNGEKLVSSNKYNFGKTDPSYPDFTSDIKTLYKFYSPSLPDYYLSANSTIPIATDYIQTGAECIVYKNPGTNRVPLYELRKTGGFHLYSTSNSIQGYTNNGIVGYAYLTSGADPNNETIPLYQYYNSTTGVYYCSTSTIALTGYFSSGIICYVLPAQKSPQNFYRYFKFKTSPTGDHFYSIETITHSDYKFEKVECLVYSGPYNPQLKPLYRFFNSSNKDHYYSFDPNAPQGYSPEEIRAYIYKYPNQDPNRPTIPLYEYYNPGNGDHFYTVTKDSYNGYVDEKIVGYVISY